MSNTNILFCFSFGNFCKTCPTDVLSHAIDLFTSRYVINRFSRFTSNVYMSRKTNMVAKLKNNPVVYIFESGSIFSVNVHKCPSQSCGTNNINNDDTSTLYSSNATEIVTLIF